MTVHEEVGLEDYDPFEFFDQHTGAGVVRDPYPEWSRLRDETPVLLGDPRQVFDLDPAMELPEGMPDTYAALSFDAVMEVLRDGDRFSSTGYAVMMGVVMGHTILEMDEPEHHAYRALVQQAFTRKAMERWESELIAPIVQARLDVFLPTGRAELVRQLTFPFPVHVIAGMLGLPHTDLTRFHRWAVELISVGFDWDRGMAASVALGEYFGAILAKRRLEPRHDVISDLAGAELDGQRLTDDEIFAFLRLLLPAGAETTYRSSSNLLYGLLRHPDQLEAVRADRALLPQAIEEGIRWEPPLTGIMRTAVADTTVCGVAIPAGSVVSVNMGAANRDPTRWERPDEFDIHRAAKPHAAFASGVHMCLGMHLARMETVVMMNAVLDRLPGLRLDPEAGDVHITGSTFRAPRSLPVIFDVPGG
jgi:cytochrome P450